ncbi:unnamed protein product [Linum trigynum]|uniref:S-protein homolog n=1 Tax=Linum trigynum TaxID=586398 RepID=A0AAV2CQF1_9ROSI
MIISQPAASAVALAIMVIIMMARPAIQEEIHVTNKLSSKILIAHCKSKDDDLGTHAIPIGEDIGWQFRGKVGTHFWCDLAVQDKRLTFVSYDWGDADNYSRNWDVRDDGVYGTRVRDSLTFCAGTWRQIKFDQML